MIIYNESYEFLSCDQVKQQTIIQLPDKYISKQINGAGEGTRTLDPQLGRLTL